MQRDTSAADQAMYSNGGVNCHCLAASSPSIPSDTSCIPAASTRNTGSTPRPYPRTPPSSLDPSVIASSLAPPRHFPATPAASVAHQRSGLAGIHRAPPMGPRAWRETVMALPVNPLPTKPARPDPPHKDQTPNRSDLTIEVEVEVHSLPAADGVRHEAATLERSTLRRAMLSPRRVCNPATKEEDTRAKNELSDLFDLRSSTDQGNDDIVAFRELHTSMEAYRQGRIEGIAREQAALGIDDEVDKRKDPGAEADMAGLSTPYVPKGCKRGPPMELRGGQWGDKKVLVPVVDVDAERKAAKVALHARLNEEVLRERRLAVLRGKRDLELVGGHRAAPQRAPVSADLPAGAKGVVTPVVKAKWEGDEVKRKRQREGCAEPIAAKRVRFSAEHSREAPASLLLLDRRPRQRETAKQADTPATGLRRISMVALRGLGPKRALEPTGGPPVQSTNLARLQNLPPQIPAPATGGLCSRLQSRTAIHLVPTPLQPGQTRHQATAPLYSPPAATVPTKARSSKAAKRARAKARKRCAEEASLLASSLEAKQVGQVTRAAADPLRTTHAGGGASLHLSKDALPPLPPSSANPVTGNVPRAEPVPGLNAMQTRMVTGATQVTAVTGGGLMAVTGGNGVAETDEADEEDLRWLIQTLKDCPYHQGLFPFLRGIKRQPAKSSLGAPGPWVRLYLKHTARIWAAVPGIGGSSGSGSTTSTSALSLGGQTL